MDKYITASHWGVGVFDPNDPNQIAPHPFDIQSSQINENILPSLAGDARVLFPSVRSGWLNRLGGNPDDCERGQDSYVRVSWETILNILHQELNRVIRNFGNESIFAGSYGWASAGRFHHAQTQLKRFLNLIGGFVRSEGNYSYNAALALMPHIVSNFRWMVTQTTRWRVIAENSKLVVMFGGVPLRNTQVSDGGIGSHRLPSQLELCVEKGVKFINISPLRSDASESINAEWLPINPGTDVALMLGLAHTIISNNLHDLKFLADYTCGFEKVHSYLLGRDDGEPKTAEWASQICGISSDRIRDLALEMANNRTMITCAAGLQRADFGEQPLWMTITLASILGQIGLPGGGFGIGYGVNGNIGVMERPFPWGNLSQGTNPVELFIPVAMITEMLMNPNGKYEYNGQTLTFPDVRLIWWAGGNPFHHHQDLNQLHAAFQKPETIIVNEFNWTATARHADIVLPVATPQERNDICAGNSDCILVPMHKFVDPPEEARAEYEIYSELAERFGIKEKFTENRSEEEWLQKIWNETREFALEKGLNLPNWDEFKNSDGKILEDPSPNQVLLADFRQNPTDNPLSTPSGQIEIFSEKIASFGYDDCPGHATWIPPRGISDDSVKQFPLALISGQPGTRLHSQFDNGAYSKSKKIQDREPILINPIDAKKRSISDGDVVEVFNQRGSCLAGAKITKEIKEGVVFLWTGAWYDPDYDSPQNRDRHGNPNVLTHDLRTSKLSQGTAAHSAFVEIKRLDSELPKIKVFNQPNYITIKFDKKLTEIFNSQTNSCKSV